MTESEGARGALPALGGDEAGDDLLQLVCQARRERALGAVFDNQELGAAIARGSEVLSPWLKRQVSRRFYGEAKPDIDDLLAEAALRTLRARPFLEAPRQLLQLQKSILSALLADFARHSSVRRREGSIMFSLQQDFAAGTAAAQLVDRRDTGEAAEIDLELKRRLARLVARLPVGERHIVWLWMQGVSLKEQERMSGRSVCRQWRSALDRLRQQLEDGESRQTDDSRGA